MTCPDPQHKVTLPDGVEMPMGKGIDSSIGQSSLLYNEYPSCDGCVFKQKCNHVFKVGGPIPWSRVLLPFYRKKLEVYPVWCSWLHNHTLFIKKLRKLWGSRPPTSLLDM